MTKERKSEVRSVMRDVSSHYDKINIYSKIRHPVLIKFNLSREQRRRSLLSQRRLGLAANRPSSLCTMMRTYLPDDDNDLLLMTLTNHTMFERLIKNITNEQPPVKESRDEEIEEHEVMAQQESRSVKEDNINDNSNSCRYDKQQEESNKINTIEQREKVECQEQKVRHLYNCGQTKDLTELIACANPAFYYHCEMKVFDDGRTIQEQLYRKKLPQRGREEQLECIRQFNRTFCETDEQLKICRALARNVVEKMQMQKYDIADDNMLNKSAEDNTQHNFKHNRTSKYHVNQENTEMNNMTDTPSSKTSALMSKSSPSSSSGIISQSRNRWERHLQDELQQEGETVESFRQAKGQESYVSKHNFARQVQWNEYQRELQMEYAQSEQQRKRERRRLIEEKFEA